LVVSVLAAAVGFGAVFLVGRALFGGDGNDHPTIGAAEVAVADVGRAPRDHSIVVRGFVFIDSSDRVLVCGARHPGDVPACAGRAIIATGLDENRLDLVTGTAPSGRPLRWSRDAVGLQGTWTGATLTVTDVLR
jgi:hypothetical protein